MKLLKILAVQMLAVALLACVAQADKNAIYEYQIWDAEVIALSTNSTGKYPNGIDLRAIRPDGYFTLFLEASAAGGAGVITFTVEMSADRTNWFTPSVVSDIATGYSKASGPGADGFEAYDISFAGCVPRYIRIKATETGGAASITLTGYLMIQ